MSNPRRARKNGSDIRHAREARTKFWRVGIVSAFFVVVLGGNLLVGAALMVKAMHAKAEESANSVRIGRVTYPMLDGVFCRNVLFDNKTVQTTQDKISRCDDRRTARRDNTTFNWGGH